MAVRSARLAGPQSLAAGGAATALFTVPAGHTYLVKSLVYVNTGAGSATLELYLNGTGVGNYLHRAAVTAGQGVQETELWWVCEPGDVVYGKALSAAITVTLFGADLLGVA